MLIVLSAKDSNRVIDRASYLVGFLNSAICGRALRPRLLDVAYTLQLGREPMEERLAFLADSLELVIEKLRLFAEETSEIAELYHSSADIEADPARRAKDTLEVTPAEMIQTSDLHKLAAWWVAGGEPDWESLYEGLEPRRISLPTYRFSRERCWFSDAAIDTNANAVLNDKKELDQGYEIASESVPNDRILTEIRQLLGAVLKLSPGRIGLRP